MIKATVILGEEAVREYEEYKKFLLVNGSKCMVVS